ncbi:hypothetical protein [Lentzea flaviverrucosa]|uniref:Uncharacterized protein n=1 Tax=Lentzea flaviverrucosa TaxID=200379 RepID=A0A1H9H943_9PSEU|nr:hypothetical protein [Lentzea flaviverrucosa]RDI34668.1 hypothetical protein DFR72_101417 [Lentzea flaviverrucosa]SEQ58757.1 hypothetical protein SAMN05216195_102800 [Lentzea flaviverrucosa]
MTINDDDLRRLLDSDLPDATLVLVEGRAEVVAARDLDTDEFRGALQVTTREDLRSRFAGPDVTGPELRWIAATLGSTVDNLGG